MRLGAYTMNVENPRLSPQEIILTTRAEHSPPDVWVHAEKAAKIFSIIALPIVLAGIGWLIQEKVTARTVNKDYVTLAVSILTQPKEANVDPAIRSWAVDLLNDNSPTKFSSTVIGQLKSGAVTLPSDQSLNLQYLARYYADRGEYLKAESLYLRALEMMEMTEGGDTPAKARLLAELATLYEKLGSPDRAKSLREKANEIYLKTQPSK
jgi:tetratricopeptide (TPR) repeat protein